MRARVKRDLATFELCSSTADIDAINFFMGADLESALAIAEKHGDLLLYSAAQFGNLPLARRLVMDCGVGAEAPGDAKLSRDWNPLMEAIRTGNVDIIRLLVDHWRPSQCLKTASYFSGSSMVHIACVRGQSEALECLIEKGASISRLLSNGRDVVFPVPPSFFAVHGKSIPCLQKLIEKGARIDLGLVEGAKSLAEAAVEQKNALGLAMLLTNGVHGGDDTAFLSELLMRTTWGLGDTSSLVIPYLLLAHGARASMSFPYGSESLTPLSKALHSSSLRKRNCLPRVAKLMWEEASDGDRAFCQPDPDGFALLSLPFVGQSRKAVRTILRAGGQCNLREFGARPPLVEACVAGNVRWARQLLRAGARWASYSLNGSALYHACASESLPCVQLLLASGADPNDPRSAVPALSGAIVRGNLEIVETLLDAGACFEASSAFGWCALPESLDLMVSSGLVGGSGWSDTFEYMVRKHEGSALHGGKSGFTPVHIAAKLSAPLVRFLIEVGKADVNAKTATGLTPMMVSCREGNIDTLRVLIENGADWAPHVTAVQYGEAACFGLDAFMVAVTRGNTDCARLLVEEGNADPDSRSSGGGMNAFYFALNYELYKMEREERLRVVEVLIDLGTAVGGADDDGDQPVHLAVTSSNMDAVSKLCQHGADINSRNKAGWTPLHFLARTWYSHSYGALDKAVDELGADVKIGNNVGEVPLHEAARQFAVGNCFNLVDLGSDVDSVDNAGRTPLMVACVGSSERLQIGNKGTAIATVRALLDLGAQVHARTHRGLQPLHFAARDGLVEVCRLLVVHAGAKVNEKTLKTEQTPLHLGLRELGVISFLTSQGARLDCRDARGRTPLYVAACEGLYSAAALLLELGARPDIVSKIGRTPLEAAKRRKHIKVVQAFNAAGFGCSGKDRNNDGILELETVGGEGDVVSLSVGVSDCSDF